MVALSSGKARRYLHLGIFNTTCSAAGFVVGLTWGPIGVASGYAIVTYLTAYPILAWAFSGTPLRFHDFLTSTYRPLIATFLATGISYWVSTLSRGLGSGLEIVILAGIFCISFVSTLLCIPGANLEVRRTFDLLLVNLRPKRL
jgi:PST family polysaccharide transporter